MYKINLVNSNGTVQPIYDQSQINQLPVIGPHLNLELSEAGSLSFSMLPGHPLYNVLMPLESYVQVLDDNEEIFYGRVLTRSHPTLTGQISFECEGALAFLLDSEIPPDAKSANGAQQSRTLTAHQFFYWCIDNHNNEVNDPRRAFTVGIVNANKKDKQETYSITSYTQTKNAIESYTLNVYGGILRVRPDGNGGHYIDWVQQYETLNPQQIQIGVNLEDQTNQFDSNSMFTVIRPVGENGLTLSEKTINLYSAEDMAKYGRIVKSIDFKNVTTESALRTAANEYVERMKKTLFVNSSIQLVDMHYLDGSIPKVHLGDRFNNINGLSGTEMTTFSMDIDLEKPDGTTLEMKNPKSLEPDLTPEGNGHGSKSLSKSHGKSSGLMLKYYHEFTDKVLIQVKDLEIDVGNLTVSVDERFEETAGEFIRISSDVTDLNNLTATLSQNVEGISYDVTQLSGTAVIQNSDWIAQLAGKFDLWEDEDGVFQVHLKDGAQLAIDEDGVTQTVGKRIGQVKERVDGHDLVIDSIQGSALWTGRDNITGIVGEFDIEYEWVPDPDNPGQYITEKHLVVKSGGGMKLRKDGVEYGFYYSGGAGFKQVNPKAIDNPKDKGWYEYNEGTDEYVRTRDTQVVPGKAYFAKSSEPAELTGGIIVDKINDQGDTYTKILGTMVDIKASQMASIGIYTDSHYDAGLLIQRINTGSTEAKLNADRIYVGDGTSRLVLNDVMTINDSRIVMKRPVNIGTGGGEYSKVIRLDPKTGRVYATALRLAVRDSSGLYDGDYEVDGNDLKQMVKTVGIANEVVSFTRFDTTNALTIEKVGDDLVFTDKEGNTLTFNKAAAGGKISSNWSGSTFSAAVSDTGVSDLSMTFDMRFTQFNVGGVATDGLEIIKTENGSTTSVNSSQIYVKLGLSNAGTSEDPYSRTTYAQLQYAAGNSGSSKADGARVPNSPQKILTNYWDAAVDAGELSGYNSAHVTGSWSTNTFTFKKVKTGSSNQDSITIDAKIAQQQGDYYAYATWVSPSHTTETSIGGTSKKLTLINDGNNKVKLQVAGNDSGLEITHNKYTAGYNSAHVTGSWNKNVFTYSKTTSGSDNEYTTLIGVSAGQIQGETGYYVYPTHWAPNATTPVIVSSEKKALVLSEKDNNTVKLEIGGTEIMTIAHNQRTAGYNSAHVTGSWSNNGKGNTFTFSKTTSGSVNSDSVLIGLGTGALQGETGTYVYPTHWTSSATTPVAITDQKKKIELANKSDNIVQLKIGGSEVATITHNKYSSGYTDATPASGTASGRSGSSYSWTFKIKLGDGTSKNLTIDCGTIYSDARSGYYTSTQYTNYGTTRYNTGWSDCYKTVGLDSTAAKTLTYGESVTVYSQAKASSSAGSVTNVSNRTIKAKGIKRITLDAGNNHANDWWNCYIYDENNAHAMTMATDQSTTGLYMPFADVELTANGRYLPNQFASPKGNTAVVFSGITVNVPTSSPPYKIVNRGTGNNCPSLNVSGFFGAYSPIYVGPISSRQNQQYQYIKFTVDGRYKAFYW